MSDDFAYMSASDLLAGYASGAFSPLEVTREVLDRGKACNDKINAFVLFDEGAALESARRSEDRWRAGAPLGRLDGVPTGIKDIVLTKGWPTLRGSKSTDPSQAWDEDAPASARLREHGAVLIGKTTTPEFGWKGVTDSPVTGITRNPWNLERTPGGSSGGASAALAAGIGALHVGTDGGGSIRIPSGFTGVFGLKATFGRVPVYPSSPFGTLSHAGPMAREVRDAALMLNVLAEPDPRDPLSLPADGRDYTHGLDSGVQGLRMAYSETLGFATTDPEVAAVVAAAVRLFEDLGARVEAADPGIGDPTPIFRAHWHAGACAVVRPLSAAQRAELDPGLIALVESRPELSLGEYQDAIAARAALSIEMARFHERYDLLLTPTLPLTAFEAGRLGAPQRSPDDWIGWTPFSYPFNLTQQPAASVPCGFAPDGLPVGLQIVGRRFDEAMVLRAAYAIEQALGLDPAWPVL